jgi:hypothetical protein
MIPVSDSEAEERGWDEESVLFQEAECAIPGKVLGEVDEEHVEERDPDQGNPAGVADEPMA